MGVAGIDMVFLAAAYLVSSVSKSRLLRSGGIRCACN